MTISSITRNLDKMVKKLREHATQHIARANKYDELAKSYEENAGLCRTESFKAHKIADNIQNIISGE